jgi:hypothetical protein
MKTGDAVFFKLPQHQWSMVGKITSPPNLVHPHSAIIELEWDRLLAADVAPANQKISVPEDFLVPFQAQMELLLELAERLYAMKGVGSHQGKILAFRMCHYNEPGGRGHSAWMVWYEAVYWARLYQAEQAPPARRVWIENGEGVAVPDTDWRQNE